MRHLTLAARWNGAPWHIRDILDEMQKKRFSSKKEAEAERKKWQPELEDWLARDLRLAANLHSDKKGQIEPRDGSAEILDKDKNKVEDEIKLDDWTKELKDLEAEGYTSLVQQGQFGKYP